MVNSADELHARGDGAFKNAHALLAVTYENGVTTNHHSIMHLITKPEPLTNA
jgi:hypothetical protein